jgi:hypothetical protein
MPVPIIAAGIGAVAAIGGAAISSSATKSAAKTQAQSTQDQLTLQKSIYDKNTANFAPDIASGDLASSRLDQLLGTVNDPTTGKPYDPTSILEATPGYSFSVDQALKGVNANAYAAGMGHSGATYKALAQRASDLATQNYNNYFNQVLDQAQRGTAAKSAIAGVGMNYANNASNTIQTGANNQANLTLVNGQNLANTLGNLGQLAGTAYSSSYGSGNKGGYDPNSNWATGKTGPYGL